MGPAHGASRPSRHSPIPSGIGEHRAEPAAWRMPSPHAPLTHIKPLVGQGFREDTVAQSRRKPLDPGADVGIATDEVARLGP